MASNPPSSPRRGRPRPDFGRDKEVVDVPPCLLVDLALDPVETPARRTATAPGASHPSGRRCRGSPKRR
eukprot:4816787-Pyramimonas_sp.AAC.1